MPTKRTSSSSKSNSSTSSGSASMRNKANMWEGASSNAKAKNCVQASKGRKSGSYNYSTEFAQDMCKLSDKEIISDVLGSHKALIKLYGTALCETDNEKLRSLIDSHLSECAEDQFDAFTYMNQRGMYPTDTAPASKVTQAKKKYGNYESTMKK